MNPVPARPRGLRSYTFWLLGWLYAAVGLGLLIWIAALMYGGFDRGQALLIGLGIPLVMLIAWCGLALLAMGLARASKRRR